MFEDDLKQFILDVSASEYIDIMNVNTEVKAWYSAA